MLITVFTPTYNRAHLLKDLYLSLCAQTYHDFEWVIVDDGSTDETSQTVEAFQQDHQLLINYYYKPNGGKHTAINFGVQKAKGELFMIVDSDDALPADSLESIAKEYDQIKHKSNLAGLAGYMAHRDGTIIGQGNYDAIESSPIETFGDMMEVYKTNILRQYPFPEILGERFCPEIVVWYRIAQKYPLYYFKKVIYYRDYISGGLTDNIIRIRMNSPISTLICYSELLTYKVSIKRKIRAAINYWRFYACLSTDRKKEETIPTINSVWRIFQFMGWLMHTYDLFIIYHRKK